MSQKNFLMSWNMNKPKKVPWYYHKKYYASNVALFLKEIVL